MVIDDIHWIDEASAALLHFVARAAVPGLVLAGGARSAELYDNPSALKLLRALGREKRLLEVPVEPLDGGAIEALARSIAPSADGARVHADCQGNPLFAIEIARASRAARSSSAQLDRRCSTIASRVSTAARATSSRGQRRSGAASTPTRSGA